MFLNIDVSGKAIIFLQLFRRGLKCTKVKNLEEFQSIKEMV